MSYNNNTYNWLRNRMNPSSNSTNMTDHDIQEEKKMIEEIKAYSTACQELYLQSLLNPEYHLAKIPSRMPVESALAGIKYNFTITPNANGYFCLIIDPYYNLAQIYQDSTVDGLGNGVLQTFTCDQDNSLIDQYRLVSSSVILKYYGNFNQMSGLFVAATCSNVKNQNYTTFLTFDNVENLNNKQVLKCVDGVKLIYTPIDEAATDFRAGSLYSAGTDPNRFQYCFIIIGYAFNNTNSIRVDYFRNLEYTVTPQYREYITQTKDLPSEFYLPNIEDQKVKSAPVEYNGGSVKNNKSWLNQVKTLASSFLKSMIPAAGTIVSQTLFPFSKTF